MRFRVYHLFWWEQKFTNRKWSMFLLVTLLPFPDINQSKSDKEIEIFWYTWIHEHMTKVTNLSQIVNSNIMRWILNLAHPKNWKHEKTIRSIKRECHHGIPYRSSPKGSRNIQHNTCINRLERFFFFRMNSIPVLAEVFCFSQ